MDTREFEALPDRIGRERLPEGHWARAISRRGEQIPKGVLLIPERSGPMTTEVREWAERVVREMGEADGA